MNAVRYALEKEILSWPEVRMKTMFGIPAYLARGTIFALCVENGIVLTSLTEEQRKDAGHCFPSHPFIARGNPIPSWVQVGIEHEADLIPLLPFLHHSYENALQRSVRRH